MEPKEPKDELNYENDMGYDHEGGGDIDYFNAQDYDHGDYDN